MVMHMHILTRPMRKGKVMYKFQKAYVLSTESDKHVTAYKHGHQTSFFILVFQISSRTGNGLHLGPHLMLMLDADLLPLAKQLPDICLSAKAPNTRKK